MSKQELNLFDLAAAIMAESGTGATKIVGRQVGYASLAGAPLDRIPDYVGCYASFLSLSVLRNPSEYFSFAHARMPEPGIHKLPAP